MSKVDLIVPKNANSFPNIQTELRHVKEAIEENQGGDEELKETVAKHTTELAEHDDELFEKIPSYVDLGLPSGKLWATMNIGAKSETDYGKYFSWGNIVGYYANEPYNFSGVNGDEDGFDDPYASTKGATLLGDNNIPVNPEFDAARAELGGDWRMPTQEEFQELYDNCIWTWTTKNGVNGYNVASKVNSNSIFLPAAGIREEEFIDNIGFNGYYWSSSFCSDDGPCWSYRLYFNSSEVYPNDDNYRCHGYSIRPIHPGTSTPAPIKRSKKANIEDVPSYTEITYNELKALRDSNKLISGSWYRITDYMTTVNQDWCTVDETHFDVIVQAVTPNMINENARCVSKSGDTYFSSNGVDPSKWHIKFSIDKKGVLGTDNIFYKVTDNNGYIYIVSKYDDVIKYIVFNNENKPNYGDYAEIDDFKELIAINNFDSEDSIFVVNENNKIISIDNPDYKDNYHVGDTLEPFHYFTGSIYEMTDENNNTCPYDFKTIQFLRYQIYNKADVFMTNDMDSDGDYYYQGLAAANWYVNNVFNKTLNYLNCNYYFMLGVYENYLTKGNELSYSTFHNITTGDDIDVKSDYKEYFFVDLSNVMDCNNGIIAKVNISRPQFFYTFSKCTISNDNDPRLTSVVDASCDTNSIVYNNKIMKHRTKINNTIFIDGSYRLVCYGNSFKGSSCLNTFGSACNNVFGNDIEYNTFDINFEGNVFCNKVLRNTFGGSMMYNTFGNKIEDNTFGNGVMYNVFGNYIGYNTFDNNIAYNTFGSSITNNTFGDSITNNTFGNSIYYNTFKNSIQSSIFGNYIQNYIFSSMHNVFVSSGLDGDNSYNRTDLTGIISDYDCVALDSDDKLQHGRIGDLLKNL